MSMTDRAQIAAFVDCVKEKFNPSAVILFGSHAYGTPDSDSDVDMLVVMDYSDSSAAAATRIRLACPRAFPMDLIVRSPAEIDQRLAMGDGFIHEIMSKGVVLHEDGHARVG